MQRYNPLAYHAILGARFLSKTGFFLTYIKDLCAYTTTACTYYIIRSGEPTKGQFSAYRLLCYPSPGLCLGTRNRGIGAEVAVKSYVENQRGISGNAAAR